MPEAALSPALVRAETLIRNVPDYPQPGIIFRDITPLLADAEALRVTTEAIIEPFAGQFDVIAGIEARGFILASAAAIRRGCRPHPDPQGRQAASPRGIRRLRPRVRHRNDRDARRPARRFPGAAHR